MRVVVGPVEAESARAWIAYARRVLTELDPGSDVPHGVIEVFAGYLDSWHEAAVDAGGDFTWEAELPAESVEYHVHAFARVAELLAERERRSGVSRAPAGADAFYRSLVEGVLGALEVEGPSHAAFATHLHHFWPGDAVTP